MMTNSQLEALAGLADQCEAAPDEFEAHTLAMLVALDETELWALAGMLLDRDLSRLAEFFASPYASQAQAASSSAERCTAAVFNTFSRLRISRGDVAQLDAAVFHGIFAATVPSERKRRGGARRDTQLVTPRGDRAVSAALTILPIARNG
jgi:hypothetical protein